MSGNSPFVGENLDETIQNVSFARWDTNEFYDDVTQDAVIFVQQCLKKSPKYEKQYCKTKNSFGKYLFILEIV